MRHRQRDNLVDGRLCVMSVLLAQGCVTNVLLIDCHTLTTGEGIGKPFSSSVYAYASFMSDLPLSV